MNQNAANERAAEPADVVVAPAGFLLQAAHDQDEEPAPVVCQLHAREPRNDGPRPYRMIQ